MEDINKAEEDSKEDSITKAEELTAVEEDSQEEVSNNKVVDMEEAKATSIQMTSASNSQWELLGTAAPLQLTPTKRDSSPIGMTVTTKMHIRISLISIVQTKDGTDN